MITFIVKATVKPGQVETLKNGLAATAAFISANEPGFASYAYFSANDAQITFINLANDAAALVHHFAMAPNNKSGPSVMGALEITSVEIYGALSAEANALVQGMNPLRYHAQSGTFDRTLMVKEALTT